MSIHTYIHTGLKKKSQEVSAKNSRYIFLKSYLSHNHPIAHFLSVRNFSGTFWKPWHLLTGTGLQTKKRQVSQGRLAMPQLARASPKTIKGLRQMEGPGKLRPNVLVRHENWARILKVNFGRPATILVWIFRIFPKLQSFFNLFQYYL